MLMKKSLILLVAVFGLASVSGVSANAKRTHHIHYAKVTRVYKNSSIIRQFKHEHVSKSDLRNDIYIMAIQMGSNNKSLHNLSHGLKKVSYRKLISMYLTSNHAYRLLNNGRNFDFRAFETMKK